MNGSSVRRESGALLAGSIVNGIGAYAFIAVGTRAVGADGFAPVAVLWAFWALSAAVLTFPVQHWVIRQMEVDGGPAGVVAARGRIVAWIVGVTGGLMLVAAVFRADLFGDGASWLWPALVAGTAAGSGYLGVLRGVLAGSGRFHAAALVIGGENVVRVAAALVLMTVRSDAGLLGVALLTGPLIGLLWPAALRFGRGDGVSGAPAALLGSAGVSLMLAQIVLNGGPPLLAALDGAEAEVTALFTALALFRAPYLLALGLTVRITAPLTRLVEDGRTAEVSRITRLGTAAVLAAAAVAAAGAWWLGPGLIRVLFGEGTDPSAMGAAGIAAGCTLALGSLALTVMLIARAGSAALTGSWVAAVAAGAVVLVAGGSLAPFDRVVAAFPVAEATAVIVMAAAMERWARR
jgi:hypothetical protein